MPVMVKEVTRVIVKEEIALHARNMAISAGRSCVVGVGLALREGAALEPEPDGILRGFRAMFQSAAFVPPPDERP